MFWKPGQKKKPQAGVSLCSFLEMLHLAVNPNLISSLIKDLRLYLRPPHPPSSRKPDAQNDAYFYHFPRVPKCLGSLIFFISTWINESGVALSFCLWVPRTGT